MGGMLTSYILPNILPNMAESVLWLMSPHLAEIVDFRMVANHK